MLITERLRIIPLERKHLESLRKIRIDPTTWHYLTDVYPINDFQQEKWFEKVSSDSTKMYFAIEISESFETGTEYKMPRYKESQFIGILRSDEYDKINRSIRIGVDISPHSRGNGYGTEALRAFIDYLFKHLNLHRIWLLVVKENKPAFKLYTKLGFVYEGEQKKALFRDGKWINYVSMSILEGEWKKKNTK